MHMRTSRLAMVATVAAATTVSFAGPALAHDDGYGHGGAELDIQAAVDAAGPGDTIGIPAGVHHQNVEITKDDITLRGRGDVIISPPAAPEAAGPTACDTDENGTPNPTACPASASSATSPSRPR